MKNLFLIFILLFSIPAFGQKKKETKLCDVTKLDFRGIHIGMTYDEVSSLHLINADNEITFLGGEYRLLFESKKVLEITAIYDKLGHKSLEFFKDKFLFEQKITLEQTKEMSDSYYFICGNYGIGIADVSSNYVVFVLSAQDFKP